MKYTEDYPHRPILGKAGEFVDILSRVPADTELKKRLETIIKYPELHAFIIRHRTYKDVFYFFTIRTKSRRKRGGQ